MKNAPVVGAPEVLGVKFKSGLMRMFFGRVEAADRNFFPSAIGDALDYLKKTGFSRVENGVHEIKEGMFAVVSEYETLSKEGKKPESHKKFVDVQCIISGEEQIGVAFEGAEQGNYGGEKDLQFYGSVEEEAFFTLKKGGFAVFFPGEIHRPGVISKRERRVRKCVVKISLSLFTASI